MKRRSFLNLIPVAGMAPAFLPGSMAGFPSSGKLTTAEANTRTYWISVLQKLADPVLRNLCSGTLRMNMPVESAGTDRQNVSHLEAFGRTLAGIAPWLELGPAASGEGALRAHYIEITRKCITKAVDPASPDFMNFTRDRQPLVDAAFMAHGLLRGYNQLWLPLDQRAKEMVVEALKSTRIIVPGNSNWLLFSAMVEAFLLKSGSDWIREPVRTALQKHAEWYKGDGVYGDGPWFHWDYYNSFVIHPMMLDILDVMRDKQVEMPLQYEQELSRARRYAAIQERLISPEGTYPPVGRSLCYRFGVFQLLAQISLKRLLPENILPEQVRSALSAVIIRQMESPETFDENGWLTVGMVGHQPLTGESYISTGSLYLCTVGLLPLGLPESDPFWTRPVADWTSKKIWKGENVPTDHALAE